jgi:hypothetical protein
MSARLELLLVAPERATVVSALAEFPKELQAVC